MKNLFKITLNSLLLFLPFMLKGQTVFHHAQLEFNIPTTIQMGYEIQIKKAGFAAHFGLVTKQSVDFLLDLQSSSDPSVQQRNNFLKTGITNSTAFDIAVKYYFKPNTNSFYISALGQFPSIKFKATAGDYVKNLGITGSNLLDKTLVETAFRLPLVGATFGKRFKIWQGLTVQAELGASYIVKQDPSVLVESKSLLKEVLTTVIQSKMEETLAQRQKSGILPAVKAGIAYTF
jgi:hypothetical protein